jgi:FYVE zinc finger
LLGNDIWEAPVWKADSSSSYCSICSDSFSVLFRKHHCRICGNLVCYYCSKNSVYLPENEGVSLSRACDPCCEKIIQKRKFAVALHVEGGYEYGSLLSSRPFFANYPNYTPLAYDDEDPNCSFGSSITSFFNSFLYWTVI